VVVREFPLTGFADYLLFVDRVAVGAIEAKAEETTLSGVKESALFHKDFIPADAISFIIDSKSYNTVSHNPHLKYRRLR